MFDFMDIGFDEPGEPTGSGPSIPDAGDCLRCGLCVGNCPTFRLFQADAETPRRRIRTLSKILFEQQPISVDERRHLDNCLQCRACETVCPSRMAYGQLFDQARAQLKVAPGKLAKLALRLIEHKRWRKRLLPLLTVYLKTGLQIPLRRSGLLNRWGLAHAEALLTKPSLPALATCYPASAATRGRVALFTGCIADHFDRETLLAAIKLLNALGYEVLVPPQQNCCGAIHQHNGQSADGMIDNNINMFNSLDVEMVLHAASGCGAMLSEYRSEDSEAAQRFRQRIGDVNVFLLKHWPDNMQLMASALKVAVHEPCSQRNVLKTQEAVYDLLQKIPGLTAAPLADNHLCCGAGGSYLLTHPDNAAQLRELKQKSIAASTADMVVSGNFGCAVFLGADGTKVMHPLALLARQLSGSHRAP